MSFDGARTPGAHDRRPDQSGTQSGYANGNSNGPVQVNGIAPVPPTYLTHRLRLNPNSDHKPDNYEDVELDFSPQFFSSLERYLPPNLLLQPRDVKFKYMREILSRYYPESERNRVLCYYVFPFLQFLVRIFVWLRRNLHVKSLFLETSHVVLCVGFAVLV